MAPIEQDACHPDMVQQAELRPESTNRRHRTIEVDLARTELHIDGIAVGALIGQGFSPVKGESAA